MKRHTTIKLQVPVISTINGGTALCSVDFTGRNSIADTGSGFKYR
jgi:hypothetical protein